MQFIRETLWYAGRDRRNGIGDYRAFCASLRDTLRTNSGSDGLVPAITVDPTLKKSLGIALGRYVKLASNHESGKRPDF